VLLLRWEKPKPQERWQSVGLGGRKKVSDSVPIFSIIVINPSASLWAGYEANKDLSLEILGLNEDFVQMNEVMTI
jgi:hypothetical protein